MDVWHISCGGAGFIAGWLIKGWIIGEPTPSPCICHCSCHHQPSSGDHTSWFSQVGFWLALSVGLLGLVANLALAFKVTVVSRGDEREVTVALTHQKGQGKQRGIFGASKGLQIVE